MTLRICSTNYRITIVQSKWCAETNVSMHVWSIFPQQLLLTRNCYFRVSCFNESLMQLIYPFWQFPVLLIPMTAWNHLKCFWLLVRLQIKMFLFPYEVVNMIFDFTIASVSFLIWVLTYVVVNFATPLSRILLEKTFNIYQACTNINIKPGIFSEAILIPVLFLNSIH